MSGIAVTIPGGGQQQRVARALGAERRRAGGDQPAHVERGEGRDDRRLDSEALDCADVRGLLEQAVRAERERQDQGDVREPSVVDGQDHDRQRSDTDRSPLERSHPLAEDQHAHEHRHERVDEVAQRGLDDTVVVDPVDVGRPVDGDDRCGRGQQQERPPVGQDRAELGGPPEDDDQEPHGEHRPQDPVRQDLDRPGRLEQRPVEREGAPQRVGSDAQDQSSTLIRHLVRIGRGALLEPPGFRQRPWDSRQVGSAHQVLSTQENSCASAPRSSPSSRLS